MKFTCLQENLSKALSTVSKAVPTKSGLPILNNVLISAEAGRLRLAATDLDFYIATYVGASVEEEGSITVPAKLLRDFVTRLTPSTLSVSLEKDILVVDAENAQGRFNGVSSSDFPEIPEFPDSEKIIEFDPAEFSSAVNLVAFAASSDATRPIFSGVLLDYSDDVFTFAASDGFRLSEKKLKIESKMPNFAITIPAKMLLELARVFGSSDEPLKFAVSESGNRAIFESNGTLIAVKILEGDFPDYKRIIPATSTSVVEVIASELLEAVRLASIFADDESSSIKVMFDSSGFLSISSSSQERGDHNSKFEAPITGDDLEILFSSRYLVDVLSNFKDMRITLGTTGSNSPCLLQPIETEGFLHLIMPIRVDN